MNYSEQQLAQMFADLPEEIQKYIMSEDVRDSVNQLIDGWEIEDKEGFRGLVFFFLIGALDTDGFLDQIRQKFKLSEDEANQLLVDMDTLILFDMNYIADVPEDEADGDKTIRMNSTSSQSGTNNVTRTEPISNDLPIVITAESQNLPSVADAKLSAPTNIPRITTTIHPVSRTPSQESQVKAEEKQAIPEKKGYSGSDPYRETPTS